MTNIASDTISKAHSDRHACKKSNHSDEQQILLMKIILIDRPSRLCLERN